MNFFKSQRKKFQFLISNNETGTNSPVELNITNRYSFLTMTQRNIRDYLNAPLNLQEYNIKSTKWLNKSSFTTSPTSTRPKKRLRTKSKQETVQLPQQKPTTSSPIEKWLQKKKNDSPSKELKKYNTLPIDIENESIKKKLQKDKFKKKDSFEKYGVIFPTAEDILKSIDTLKREGEMLDEYDDLVSKNNTSIPDSLKSLLNPAVPTSEPLLTCENLSKSELESYCSKHSKYLQDISDEIEFSKRHETYKNQNNRSRLTYSFSTMVFSQAQLELLMENIETLLDPEGKQTEYLFMVAIPELCLKIFMDLHNMSKEEAIKYLNDRPVD